MSADNQTPLRWGVAEETTPGRLSDESTQLLREAVAKHNPELLPLVGQLGVTPLTCEQREALRGAVSTEFCITGLREDDEPNQRGLDLEEVIDVLGHL